MFIYPGKLVPLLAPRPKSQAMLSTLIILIILYSVVRKGVNVWIMRDAG